MGVRLGDFLQVDDSLHGNFVVLVVLNALSVILDVSVENGK